MPGNRITREKLALEFLLLSQTTRTAEIWKLSDAFVQCDSVDDDCFSPLDSVVYNPSTRRYEYGGGDDAIGELSMKEKLHQDDFILQAMVIWNLHRMEHGIGVPSMLRTLSVWGGKKLETDLPNFWADEIKELQQPTTMTTTEKKTGKPKVGKAKLGKGLNHPDNFDTFHRYYRDTHTGLCTPRWKRRSNTQFNYVHELGEQAVVQWALHHYGQDASMKELACRVITLQYQGTISPVIVPKILNRNAVRSNGDSTFVKNASRELESGDSDGEQKPTTLAEGTTPPRTAKRPSTDDDASSSSPPPSMIDGNDGGKKKRARVTLKTDDTSFLNLLPFSYWESFKDHL